MSTAIDQELQDIQRVADTIQSVDQFRRWVCNPIRSLIPHQSLACGHGRIHAAGIATDYIRFTAEAIKQIRDDYAAANNNAIPSLDYVRSKLDVTGHSLGGALAELVGKFTYWVSDGQGGETPATVTLDIASVNDLPQTLGEQLVSNEDIGLIFSPAQLLANDADTDTVTDGQVLGISRVGQATHGAVWLDAQGQVRFLPQADYNGPAQFTYWVGDGQGGEVPAIVALTLNPVNDAPETQGETSQGNEDEGLLFSSAQLLANDTDVDTITNGQVLGISRVGQASHGSVTLDAQGQVRFLPQANYNGPAQFTYWVSDGQGGETPATVVLTLRAVNDLPEAQGEQMVSQEDEVLVFDPAALLANDSDVDVDTHGQVLSVTALGSVDHGTVAWHLEADGSRRVVFTPEANYFGPAGFAYTVDDGAGGTATARVALTVASVNDAPIAVDDRFATYRGSTMRVAYDQLLGNDRDLEGDALTLGAVRENAHGQVSLVDGQVQFVLQAGYLGAAAFDYRVDDGQGGQTWATAFVDVKLPPNLYPTMSLSSGGYSDAWYGGSAYYNAVAVWQNFSYRINDESPGTVSFRFVEQVGELVAGSLGSSTFQFHVYDSWGADGVGIRFDVVLTDQEGVTNTAHVQTGYDLGAIGNALRYFAITHDHSGLYVSTVVLDLDGNGVGFAPLATSGVALDVDADGVADRLAWADASDGVLVWDQDHDGRVSGVQEFSFQHLVPGAVTDLQGLQALDDNANGQLDVGDAAFSDFVVWRDANGNGQVDQAEFGSLAQRGIASIDLHSNAQWRDAGAPLAGSAAGQTDVVVMGETRYTRSDGTVGVAADVMLAYQRGAQSPLPSCEPAAVATHGDAQPQVLAAAPLLTNPEAATAPLVDLHTDAQAAAQVAEVIRMALLFNQLCTTAVTQEAAPLGFMPLQPDPALAIWEEAAGHAAVAMPAQPVSA